MLRLIGAILIITNSIFSSCISSTDESDQNHAQTEQQEPVVEVIDTTFHVFVPDLLKNTREVLLSDMARTVRYIPLETTKQYIIGEKTVHVKPAGEYIFVNQHHSPIGMFDKDGKFIRTIGKIGRGPEEFNHDYLFWPDATTRSIYVWNANRGSIMEYSYEDEFIREIKPGERFGAFAPLGHHKFLSWSYKQFEKDGQYYKVYFHDETGEIYHRVFEPQEEFNLRGGIMMPQLTRTENGFNYSDWKTPAIYHTSADGTFKEVLTWDLDKYKMPFSGMDDYERYKRERHAYVRDMYGCESGSFWYLKYFYKKGLNVGLLDKRNGEYYTISNFDREHEGLYNDIDGGPSFWPFWDNWDGKYFIKVIQAWEIIAQINNPDKVISPKNPQQAEELKKLVDGLTENSNPVLMLVELK